MDRVEGVGLQPPHYSLQTKISTLLLNSKLNKSCKVTKTADYYDAQTAGNGISEILTKISLRPPSPKNPKWITCLEFDLNFLTSNYVAQALNRDLRLTFCPQNDLIVTDCWMKIM